MSDTQQRNEDQTYIYYTPSSAYNYPNKPYEPFPLKPSEKPMNKRKKKMLICLIITFLIIAIGLFLSYRYLPSVKHFVTRNFYGADKYYLYTESTNLKKGIASLYDYTSQSSISTKDKNPSILNSYRMLSKDINLLNIEYLQDNNRQYLLFPQISEQYIDITEILRLFTTLSDEYNTTEILDRYVGSFIENITKYSRIHLEKDTTLDLSAYTEYPTTESPLSTYIFDEFTVSITEKDVNTILLTLIDLLKEDQEFIELVEVTGVDSYYFQAALSYIKAELQNYKPDSKTPLIEMEVYTHMGDILARNINFGKEGLYKITCVSSPYESSDLLTLNESQIISIMDKEQLKKYMENSSIASVLDTLATQFSLSINKDEFSNSFLFFLIEYIYRLVP